MQNKSEKEVNTRQVLGFLALAPATVSVFEGTGAPGGAGSVFVSSISLITSFITTSWLTFLLH